MKSRDKILVYFVISASLLTCHSRGDGNLENNHAVCLVSVDGDITGSPIKVGDDKWFG